VRRAIADTPAPAQPPRTFEIEWGAKPAPRKEPEAPAAAMPDKPEVATSVIELCDWLDRVRDEQIPPARGIEIAARKADTVLATLDLSRIDRRGAFAARDQQIVDSVATDSAEEDMRVCQTVQCGYRAKDRVIRPQRVMVYRFSATPAGDDAGEKVRAVL
jgi:molecular chaperone GrpE (heat shock protein)